jgi:hypothetical protein
MFDDTSFDRLYGDPILAHDAIITALACKALTKICEDSQKAGESRRLSRCATPKAARILRRSLPDTR